MKLAFLALAVALGGIALLGVILLIVVGVIVVVAIGIEIVGTIAYRRWRRRFDSLVPDEQRKEQERLYKVEEWRS